MDATNSITTFNDHLAQAKLAALQILQNLASTLVARGDKSLDLPYWPGRELRLIAGIILRTKPIDATPPPRRAPPPDTPPTQSPPPATTPTSPAGTGPPTDTPSPPIPPPPQDIPARRDLRTLVRDGHLPASFLPERLPLFDRRPSLGPAP